MSVVVEGNFCRDGIALVADRVAAGTLTPAVLFGEVRGVCTGVGAHTEECARFYHHHTFRAPEFTATSALVACWARFRHQPTFVTRLLQSMDDAGGLSHALVAGTGWHLHPGVRAVARRMVMLPTRATHVLAVLTGLPTPLMIADPLVVTIADAAASRVVADYRRFLRGHSPASAVHPDSWVHDVAAACTEGMTAYAVPLEVQWLVLGYLVSPEWLRYLRNK